MLEAKGLLGVDVRRRVKAGLLSCQACRTRFPIYHGVPVMLLYRTNLHARFE